ncbi:MAG: chemotaxis response regulator protein-glutamate methylesterase [Dorea sp.]|jgi:two-component system chemotaxis response regulator CheB|nr:chemotaxis response regulator protein-glutamate methylesterase [Dorea sp.]
MNNKIKVLVVDDSSLFRQALISHLSSQPGIEVIGYAINAYDAKQKIPQLKPDVLTLDVEMPGLNGIEFLKQLLPTTPLPVVLVSSLNLSVFDALSAGAVDFVRKPDMSVRNSKQTFFESLTVKVMTAAKAKVRITPPGTTTPNSPTPVQSQTPAQASSPLRQRTAAQGAARPMPYPALSRNVLDSTIIGLGASTGGTEATLEVLKRLPGNIPGIVITQHMPEGFTEMYAQRLNRICNMEVREAKNGDVIHPGLALIAPGAKQMEVIRSGRNYIVQCRPGAKVSGHCPSVDVLFNSIAANVAINKVGIIMTGMGRDGADGLLKMRQNGAFTIGQDKESCVVYGMPMVAYNIGAVCTQASCENISSVLMNHLNGVR